MDQAFQYSILRYRPSLVLGEQLNVGLIFYFASDHTFHFIYPNHLSRISHFYPHLADLTVIRQYLKVFHGIATRLSKGKWSQNVALSDVIQEYFLRKDANSFFFSEVKFGFSSDADAIISFYKEQFFKYYENPQPKQRRNEVRLRNQFEKQLARRIDSLQINKLFRKQVTIKNNIGETAFDFAWQNGSANLVKAISFDVSKKETIQQKAFRWYGELSRLNLSEKADSYRFDLLVAKPSAQPFYTAYDNALQLLETISHPLKIVEEEQLEVYAQEAVDTVQEPSSNLNHFF
ncbi:MAG: DUF3037 domain-containing protein [Bacteroidota bacterium]